LATITRPAALVRQGVLRLYATSLQVRDLMRPNFYTINKLDSADEASGYQRLLNEGRAKRLAEYLLDGHAERDAFLPTSIFLATSKSIQFDSSTHTISFDLDDVGPLSVVDGQHRIAGLVLAAERNPELLEFEIPVNIAVELDDISQMCHFLIVNTTQKSVDKAVEQQIVGRLTKMISLEKMPTMPRWIRRQVDKGEDARALSVATFLNSDPKSPWRGKIRMANDDGDKNATTNQGSFINSLKRNIFSANNPLSNPVWDTNRAAILLNYWSAVFELLVDDSEIVSMVYKTNGVEFFHLVSATVFTHLAARKDFKKETIKALLTRAFENLPPEHVGLAHPQWWQRGNEASGMNRVAIAKLASALSHAMNVQDDASTAEI